MRIEVRSSDLLRFDDGSPVRAASAIAPFGGGWLVAQDDATHAAWWTTRSTTAVRLFPPVDGHDVFSEAAGTKHLKPDLEAACPVEVDARPAVLLLGSGSTPARMRAALVQHDQGRVHVVAADLTDLYAAVAEALGVGLGQLNIEGSCRDGERLRLFHRGGTAAGAPSASVDVALDGLVPTVARGAPGPLPAVGPVATYDLGRVDGVHLAVTDAVALPDGRVLVSAAAEDAPNAVDDGPVVAAALAVLDGGRVHDVTPLPHVGGRPHKVEGLALRHVERGGAHLVAVVDADDPGSPSLALDLAVRWS